MAFKWNDHDQKLDKVLGLMEDWEPLFGQKTGTRTKHACGTNWVVLKKKDRTEVKTVLCFEGEEHELKPIEQKARANGTACNNLKDGSPVTRALPNGATI